MRSEDNDGGIDQDVAERKVMRDASADMREVLSTKAGRSVMWGLLSDCCGYFDASFSGDPPETFYREGKRSVGALLASRMRQADKKILAKLIDEHGGN